MAIYSVFFSILAHSGLIHLPLVLSALTLFSPPQPSLGSFADPFAGFNGPIPIKAQRLLGSCPTNTSSRVVSRRFQEEGDPTPRPRSLKRPSTHSCVHSCHQGLQHQQHHPSSERHHHNHHHHHSKTPSQKRIRPPQIKVLSVTRKADAPTASGVAAGNNAGEEEIFICISPSSNSIVAKELVASMQQDQKQETEGRTCGCPTLTSGGQRISFLSQKITIIYVEKILNTHTPTHTHTFIPTHTHTHTHTHSHTHTHTYAIDFPIIKVCAMRSHKLPLLVTPSHRDGFSPLNHVLTITRYHYMSSLVRTTINLLLKGR